MSEVEEDVLDSREAGGKIIRGGGLRVGSYVGGIVIGLISAPLLVRHLSVADYGLFATVTSITFVVGGLTEGGLANVAVRRYANADADERRHLLDSLLGLRLALTAAGCVLAIAFTVVAGYPWEVTAGVAIATIGLLLGSWQNTIALALQAQLKLGSLAAIDLARQAITTLLIVALVVAGAGLVAFFAVSPVGLACMLAATLVAARAVRPWPRRDPAAWRGLLHETALYAAATALGVVYFQVAIISTSLLAGETQAGFYGAAFRIVELANGVPWLLSSAAFPLLARAAHNDADRLRYATQRLLETALLIGGLFCAVIAVGAPFALQVIGGSKLDPAIPALRLLGFGVPFTFIIATWSFTLLSLRRHTALVASNGLAVVTALALSFALIPAHGATGAAIVTVTLEVVLATAYGIALWRARPELRPRLASVWRVPVALGAALAAGFLLPLGDVPATFAATAVYLAVAYALGAVPAEISAALRDRLPGRG